MLILEHTLFSYLWADEETEPLRDEIPHLKLRSVDLSPLLWLVYLELGTQEKEQALQSHIDFASNCSHPGHSWWPQLYHRGCVAHL